MSIPISGTFGYGLVTATAGTVITRTLPAKKRHWTHLLFAKYIAGATAHTLTVMQALGTTTLSAAAAAGQAVVALTADPGVGTASGVIAANDYVVIEKPDGTFHTGIVSSVSGLNVTLTANVPTGGFAALAPVWFFGVIGDGHPQYTLTASVATTLQSTIGSVVSSLRRYQPLILHSGNATNAGVLDLVSGCYSTVGPTTA